MLPLIRYLVKGDKLRLVGKIVRPFSQRKSFRKENLSAASYSINEAEFRANIQLTRRSSGSIKRLEDTLRLHVSVEASNRLETG